MRVDNSQTTQPLQISPCVQSPAQEASPPWVRPVESQTAVSRSSPGNRVSSVTISPKGPGLDPSPEASLHFAPPPGPERPEEATQPTTSQVGRLFSSPSRLPGPHLGSPGTFPFSTMKLPPPLPACESPQIRGRWWTPCCPELRGSRLCLRWGVGVASLCVHTVSDLRQHKGPRQTSFHVKNKHT